MSEMMGDEAPEFTEGATCTPPTGVHMDAVNELKRKGWLTVPMFYGSGENLTADLLMVAPRRVRRATIDRIRNSMPEPPTPRDRIEVEGVGKLRRRGRRPCVRYIGDITTFAEVVSILPDVSEL